MTWFLLATRARLLLVTLAVTGLAAGALHGQTALVPTLGQTGLAPAPVVAVVALAPALGVLWGWSGVSWASLACSGREPSHLLGLAYVVAPAVYALASMAWGDPGGLAENLRDALGLTGLTVLGARVLGERGAVTAPVAFLLGCFLVGRPRSGTGPSTWAWVLHEGGSASGLAGALTLWVGGLAVLGALPRRLALCAGT